MFFVTKIIKKEEIPFILSYFYRKMINFANQLRNIIQIINNKFYGKKCIAESKSSLSA